MAGSVNKVIIVGNLGRDPESKAFQNGGKVVNLRIATSESWKDKMSGERKEKTEWHSVAIFNEGLANVAEKYLRKGSKVYIEGRLQTRKWQGQDGQDRYTTEIVANDMQMLDSRGGGGGGFGQSDPGDDWGQSAPPQRSSGGGGGAPRPAPTTGPGPGGDDFDDDIPF